MGLVLLIAFPRNCTAELQHPLIGTKRGACVNNTPRVVAYTRRHDGQWHRQDLVRGGHKTTRNFFVAQNDAKLEMWANAQRDGRTAEHRWRPLFNAAKFG